MNPIKSLKKRLRGHVSRKQLNAFHLAGAVAANIKYRFPARKMLVIGVTGTKGKTTTCYYIASILEEAGYKVAMATTVNFQIGEKKWINDLNKTVLPPDQLFDFFRQANDARCDIMVMEVTSHSIEQQRIWGIPFRYVGFTNLSHDHLDYHGTMDAYRDVKLRLFQKKSPKACASNADDPVGRYFLEHTKIQRRWSYSTESADMPINATDHLWADKISANSSGASFTLRTLNEEGRVVLQLPGRFNIENALCAAALCMNLNLRLGTVIAGLEKVDRVPGRLERIETRKGFSVLIDYAHTPDSLEKLYSTLRPDIRGRMIAVLGATGDRDKTKRPIMGALAARFCDYVILTDEEPYTENPQTIIDEIARGVPRGRTLFKANKPDTTKRIFKDENETGEGVWWWRMLDRKAAIDYAISLGKMDDIILVTGMGAQKFKMVNDEKSLWDERAIIEEILHSRKLLD